MSYCVKSKIQEFAKKNDMNVGSDFYPEVDKKIEFLLKDATKRAKDNKRKTLKAYDI